MIELRWFKHPIHDPYCDYVSELQYRVDPPQGLGHWSEWQAVPTVVYRDWWPPKSNAARDGTQGGKDG